MKRLPECVFMYPSPEPKPIIVRFDGTEIKVAMKLVLPEKPKTIIRPMRRKK